MKYIIWPIFVVTMLLILSAVGTLKLIMIPIWNFRLTSVKEAYTFDGNYLFEDCTWKEFFKCLITPQFGHHEEDDKDDEDDYIED